MTEFVYGLLTEFDLPCGCRGYKLIVPEVASFWVYERTCIHGTEEVNRNDPEIVYRREETSVDLGGFDGQPDGGHEIPPFYPN